MPTAEDYLRRALELAAQGRGQASPNPLVGAVIVRDGVIVGEGYHAGPGTPHAERVALAQAGEAARGATLYTTLEPCCHHGRTPPCTDGILEAGVAEVWFSLTDPDPKVAGHGAEILRAAGLRVHEGTLAGPVRHQLRAYLHHRTTGRPWVLAKWAMTLDGKLAAASGDSHWISGPESRAIVHRLRAEVDGILCGAGTILADNPRLTSRPDEFGPGAGAVDAAGGGSGATDTPPSLGRPGDFAPDTDPASPAVVEVRQPVRIVVDSHGRTPASARVYTDGAAPTWLATCDGADRPGAEMLRLPTADGRVDLAALLDELGRRRLVEVMVESGGELLGALFRQGLVNEVACFIAPKLVGGPCSPWPTGGFDRLADALTVTGWTGQPSGSDWLLRGIVAPAG